MKTIDTLEKRHPDLIFTESDAHCLYYVTCVEKRIGILVKRYNKPDQMVTLTQEQAYALSKELPEILFMIGRKRSQALPGKGRPRKYN